ncbi:MAG: hypothetical protein RIQ97_1297 [Pseudomonadota bacterium]|jgi:glycosyltransferase involved in cell wall biosynthesis
MSAIFYHPEAYTTTGPRLMGRHAAGSSFVRGWLQHSRSEAFWLQVDQVGHEKPFVALARQLGRQEPIRVVPKPQMAALSQVGTVYHPGPGLGAHARLRSLFGHTGWGLCGITHTTSSTRAMDSIAEWLTAPVQPWDAVICTSQAVKQHVQGIVQAEAEHLRERLGAQRWVLPMMPVIPLGIHTQDFVFDAGQRLQARERVGAGANTMVVLFMGRLSFHAKAHPLAMYQALERAAQRTGQQVLLLECGWHANEAIASAFAEAARQAAPSVRTLTLDGRDAATRDVAWACADVFCSLSDNIQETFGLVPLEAMAAGLPVVVSDWDGYRDTVRDGVDGFRIPTWLPPAGTGRDLAFRHAAEIDTYDMYCGHTCSVVGVDVDAAALAFERLFASDDLRRQMGAAGRARAQSLYDWAQIVPQYEALWAEQDRVRQAQTAKPVGLRPWAARMDPFDSFSHYATHQLQNSTRLSLAHDSLAQANQGLQAVQGLQMVRFAQETLPGPEVCAALLQRLAQGPQTVQDLLDGTPPVRQHLVLRGMAWLVKLGILRASPLE